MSLYSTYTNAIILRNSRRFRSLILFPASRLVKPSRASMHQCINAFPAQPYQSWRFSFTRSRSPYFQPWTTRIPTRSKTAIALQEKPLSSNLRCRRIFILRYCMMVWWWGEIPAFSERRVRLGASNYVEIFRYDDHSTNMHHTRVLQVKAEVLDGVVTRICFFEDAGFAKYVSEIMDPSRFASH